MFASTIFNLIFYIRLKRQHRSKEITTMIQTKCSLWNAEDLMLVLQGCMRAVIDHWHEGSDNQVILNSIWGQSPPNPEIQCNQCWQWDAVWRVVYQYLWAKGGRCINQCCLWGSECTRIYTVVGRKGLADDFFFFFFQTKTYILSKSTDKSILLRLLTAAAYSTHPLNW